METQISAVRCSAIAGPRRASSAVRASLRPHIPNRSISRSIHSQSRAQLRSHRGGIWGNNAISSEGQEWHASATNMAQPGNRGELVDPMQLLLRNRVVFIGTQIDDAVADEVVSQLMILEHENDAEEIRIYVNSPGGSVNAGMAIYDAMQAVKCDVSTTCFGLAASVGALIVLGGTKGKRFAMPNCRIMLHQPLGGVQGTAEDVEVQARELIYHRANLNRIISLHTGQDVKKVDRDTDRDNYMSSLEAKSYGIVDQIIGGDEAVKVVPDSELRYLRRRKDEAALWDKEKGKGESEKEKETVQAWRSGQFGDRFLPGSKFSVVDDIDQ